MRSSLSRFQDSSQATTEARDESWFYTQLSSKVEVVNDGSKDFKIVCPFHDDHNPSLGVDKSTGRFFCWSCKAGGGWNKLAKQIGLPFLKKTVVSTNMDDVVASASRALRDLGVKQTHTQDQNERRQLKVPTVEAWAHGDWRGIPESYLRKIGSLRVVDFRTNVLRIGLPVRDITGQVVGYTCRAIEPKDAEPKYAPLAADRITWRDKHLPTKGAMFLLDRVLAEGWTRCVLVEGPVGALWLWSHGIPALAMLGVANWTADKAAMLAALGMEAVIVLTDSDRAGTESRAQIVSDLRRTMRTKGLRLPDGMKDYDGVETNDPTGMDIDQMVWLKKCLTDL